MIQFCKLRSGIKVSTGNEYSLFLINMCGIK